MRLLLAFGVLSLSACAADVGEGRAVAEVVDAPAAVAPVEVATRLSVDTSRSKIHALGAKITAQHPIVFHEFSGSVGLDAAGAVASVEFTAQVASLESDHPRLTSHLKDEDFLFAEKFPTATFVSTAVSEDSVTGDLTIRGKTKRVTFPAQIDAGAEAVTASAEFVIDRQDFGVTYPGKKDDLVQDNVALTISFVAPLEQAPTEG